MAESIAPAFLIAVPHLLDPNFRQSVILLLQQDDDGAFGLVVNREAPMLLRELCRDHRIDYSGDPGKRVRLGGPVQPEQGFVLYGAEHDQLDGREVAEGVLVSASTDALSRLCADPGGRFQCYSGYAGWGPGQLEREIKEGSWIIGPAVPHLVLDPPGDGLWERCLGDLGIDPNLLVPGGSEEA
jgi:putative transcriptional regulator